MTARPAPIARFILAAVVAGGGLGLLVRAGPPPAEAAPLAAVSLGLIPGSGPPGMTITAVGSGWTLANNPYAIFWDAKGGTGLGTFAPDVSGNWSTPITIPAGASAGPHTVIACEGYTNEFEQCASATFTVVPPTATITPTRTRTPSPTPGAVRPVTWTPTRTPSATPLSGCIDGFSLVSPAISSFDRVAAVDLVLEVTIGDPTATTLLVYGPMDTVADPYTRWPDPVPGTVVEAEPSATVPNRWLVTVRDYPLREGTNAFRIALTPSCSIPGERVIYLYNGPEPTATPRPDACGGLGLPADATLVDFERLTGVGRLDQLSREEGIRFEGSMEPINPRPILPRSGSYVGASIEGLEFGSATLPIRIAFDRPLAALGLFVGMPDPFYATGDVIAVLTAYGYHAGSTALELLGSDSTSFPAAPTDLIHCLRFTAAEGDIIARALIEYTDAAGNSLAERRLIDDLTIVYAGEDLPPDRPPLIEITSPTDGGSIPGTTVNLRATIHEDRELDRVAYQIDGGPEMELGAAPSLTDPTAFLTGANFSAAIVEAGVPHLLSVTAYDSAGQFAADTVRFIVPTPVPTLDLQAVKMEVVQVVQCLDNPRCVDNAVPMIIGKPTWARLYVRAEGGPPSRPVSGRLCRGRVATCDAASMVLPLNAISPDGDDDPSANDRGDLRASLNFVVPPAWLAAGPLEMTAFVNYDEIDVDEIRADNNMVQASVSVIPARAMTVMFSAVTADGITARIDEMWSFADWLARVFPVTRLTAVRRAPLPGNFDLSDSSGNGCGRTWNGLMDALNAVYTWGGRAAASLYGLVPPEANTAGVLGCGNTPGRIASGVTSGGTRWGPEIAAQELAHNLSRGHAPGCDAGNPDPGYPRRRGTLDDWGIDLTVRQLYPPNTSFDYMGYCGSEGDTWTSVYTYLGMLASLPVADAPTAGAHLAAPFLAEGEPSLIGGGQISPGGFLLERGFYRASLAEGITDGLPDGPYTVELRDAGEFPLYARNFTVLALSNSEPTDEGYFQIILPDLPETASIVFLYDGDEIGRVSASANAPQVSITEPVGGEDWAASGAHTITWQASDADGDSLRLNVQYSPDGGKTWEPISLDLVDAVSVSVDSGDLPGGNLLFRVLASDGLNTAVGATTSPVRVSNKPPEIHLASPINGDWLPAGEAVIFRGYATDLEDVVVADEAYRWSSSLDGDLGSGPTLWGIPLTVGDHQITLEVTDSMGQAVRQSVTIRVGGVDQAQAPAPPSPLILVLGLGGLILLLGAGIGALVYFLRARPARP